MLIPGRIQMTPEEEAGIEKLLAEHPEGSHTLTRRDPGESGPVLVHVGDNTWEIAEDGKRKKVT